MSEQNRYRIAWNYKSSENEEWAGWKNSSPFRKNSVWRETADTWQDAIQRWIDYAWPAGEYTVVSETPSEDGKSGTIEIQFVDQPRDFWEGAKIKATLIED